MLQIPDMQRILASCLTCFILNTASAQLPAVDIWYAHISLNTTGLQLSGLTNITQRVGYDNQPSFSSDGNTIMYTSIRDEKQADIYQYDINSKLTAQVTNTIESEYSPILINDDRSFVTVRVEKDSTQRLWEIRMKDAKAKLYVEGVDSVGYYWLVNDNIIPCFMVTDTPSLMLVNKKKNGGRTIAENIGRCIKLLPGTDKITYLTKDTEQQFTIRAYDFISQQYEVITEVPAVSEDYVWTSDKKLLMPRGNAIWIFDAANPQRGWVKGCEIPSLAGKNIYRMALSPDGKTLAFVADE